MIIRLALPAALLCAFSLMVSADNPQALPLDNVSQAKVAAPAFVETVTFKVQSEGETRSFTVTSGPVLARIDAPDDRMSVIYDPRTQHYIGLEHSNYTYWDFIWPNVRDSVLASQRYAAHLRDLGPEALSEEPAPTAVTDTNTAPSSSSVGSDDTGYVWRPTADKKRIAGFNCVRWTGETVAGEGIDAWCTPGLLPPVEKAVATLHEINEPMALVPVRNFVPSIVFVAWDAMTKAGVTPVLITWGTGDEAGRFALAGQKEREGRLDVFEVPKLYVKTTIVTMDGIGNQKPVTGDRGYTAPTHEHAPINAPNADGGLQ